jgi:hypothetical protein
VDGATNKLGRASKGLVLRGVGELCALHAGARGSPAAGTEAAAVAAAAAAAAAAAGSRQQLQQPLQQPRQGRRK